MWMEMSSEQTGILLEEENIHPVLVPAIVVTADARVAKFYVFKLQRTDP